MKKEFVRKKAIKRNEAKREKSRFSRVLFSSASELWETPQDLFDKLNAEFGFSLDVCAIAANAKCENYFTPEMDGLKQDWSENVAYMNCPYSRTNTPKWVKKAFEESLKGATVVALLPSRTGTKWFHSYVVDKADDIRYLPGRLKFGNSKNSAPFDSIIVVWKGKKVQEEIIPNDAA